MRDNDSIDLPNHVTLREWFRYQFESDPAAVVPGDDLGYRSDNGADDWTKAPKDTLARMGLEVEYATYSDYSGSNTERANYRALKRDFGELLCDASGGYGTESLIIPLSVWRRERCGACGDFAKVTMAEALKAARTKSSPFEEGTRDERCDGCERAAELRKAIHALDDYPVYDEDTESEIDMEREGEDWESWACDDFKRSVLEAAERGGVEPTPPATWTDADWRTLFYEAGGETERDGDGSTIFRTKTWDDERRNRAADAAHRPTCKGYRCPECPEDAESVVSAAAEMLKDLGWTFPPTVRPDWRLVRRLRGKLGRDKRKVATWHRRYGKVVNGRLELKRTPPDSLKVPYYAAFKRMGKVRAALDKLAADYGRDDI